MFDAARGELSVVAKVEHVKEGGLFNAIPCHSVRFSQEILETLRHTGRDA